MRRRVVYSRAARADLRRLFIYIATRSGPARALGYVERIEEYCRGFQDFPERGTRRDDLRPGLRTIGFERRVTIAFRLNSDTVIILGVFYGGRDLTRAFGDA